MEQCSLCRFWLNWDSEDTNLGECHRFPPREQALRLGIIIQSMRRGERPQNRGIVIVQPRLRGIRNG